MYKNIYICLNKILPLVVLHFLYISAVNAQSDTSQDLGSVQILARSQKLYALGQKVSEPDSLVQAQAQGQHIGELLALQLPVFIKSYGNGMLNTLSFRGTGGEHTALLWNGFSLNNVSNGLIDLANIPSFHFSKIQIFHGASSASFGSGAIGGTVNLSNELRFSKKIVNTSEYMLQHGSFGRAMVGGNYTLSLPKNALHISWSDYEMRNTFEYINNTKVGLPTETVENAGIKQAMINAAWMHKLSEKSQLKVYINIGYQQRHLQQGIGTAPLQQLQTDRSTRLGVEWSKKRKGSLTTARAGYFRDSIVYQSINIQSPAFVQNIQTEIARQFHYKSHLFNIGLDGQYINANVLTYGQLQNQLRYSAYIQTKIYLLPKLAANINIRQPFMDKKALPTAPYLGLYYTVYSRPLQIWLLKFNTSSSYRLPTFNEQYWQPGGNKEIKPELARNVDLSMLHRFCNAVLNTHIEASIFYMYIQNWIQWQPTSSGYWAASNIGIVKNRGFELTAHAEYLYKKTTLRAGTNFSYITAAGNKNGDFKQLIYIPYNTANAHISYIKNKWAATALWQYTGFRFTASDHSNWLPAYHLFHINISYHFKIRNMGLDLLGKVNNVLNTNYQVIENFAMPRRNYLISLHIKF
jgi:iron complex outermembrane receptor protein